MDQFISAFSNSESEEAGIQKLMDMRTKLASHKAFGELSPIDQQLALDEFDQRTKQATELWRQTNKTPQNEWSQADPTVLEAYQSSGSETTSKAPTFGKYGEPASLEGLSEAGTYFWTNPRFAKIDPAKRTEVAHQLVDYLEKNRGTPQEQIDQLKLKASTEVLAYNEREGIQSDPWIDPMVLADTVLSGGALAFGKAGVRLMAGTSNSVTKGIVQGAMNLSEPAMKLAAKEAIREGLAQGASWGMASIPIGMATEQLLPN